MVRRCNCVQVLNTPEILRTEYERVCRIDSDEIQTVLKPAETPDSKRDRYNNIKPYSNNVVRSRNKTGK